jgi:uncharacterized caspase-like protein
VPPRRVAIVIGANGPTRFQRLTQLHYAESDADRVTAVLASPICGYEVLRPGQTQRQIMRTIEAEGRKLDYRDHLLVYFSGHGVQHYGRLRLVLNSSKNATILTTTLCYEQINLAFRSTRSNQKVIILDCCHSGLAIDDRQGLRVKGEAIAEVVRRQTEGSAAAVLAACGPDVAAREVDKLGGGVLSSLIVSALSTRRAEAADDETGCVSTESLRNWISWRIDELRKDPEIGVHLERPILETVGASPTYLTVQPALNRLERLLASLAKGEREEQQHAVEELRKMGPAAAKAVPALIAALEDNRIGMSAARALGEIGPAAIVDLTGALANSFFRNPKVRQKAAFALMLALRQRRKLHDGHAAMPRES